MYGSVYDLLSAWAYAGVHGGERDVDAACGLLSWVRLGRGLPVSVSVYVVAFIVAGFWLYSLLVELFDDANRTYAGARTAPNAAGHALRSGDNAAAVNIAVCGIAAVTPSCWFSVRRDSVPPFWLVSPYRAAGDAVAGVCQQPSTNAAGCRRVTVLTFFAPLRRCACNA